MTGLDDLVALDVRSLCESLAMHRSERHELASGQWLSVVELLAMQLTEDWRELEGHWPTCSAALTYALETAVASNAIDRRKKIIRSLNESAFLLQRVQSNAGVTF